MDLIGLFKNYFIVEIIFLTFFIFLLSYDHFVIYLIIPLLFIYDPDNLFNFKSLYFKIILKINFQVHILKYNC